MSTFRYAVWFRIHAECVTPFRTGSAEGDKNLILKGSDGRYLLQGASIAGALREWTRQAYGKNTESLLFGDREGAGFLTVSDGVFDEKVSVVQRPRLKIDAKTGTAENGKKFDITHITPGAKFSFELVLRSAEPLAECAAVVEEMLRAVNAGEIRFGGQKSNGFGRVGIRATRQDYNLSDNKDRRAWLDEKDSGKPVSMKGIPVSRLICFKVTGDLPNVLVKSGAPEVRDGRNITANIRENGTPVIPGSSVKGAIRGRCEFIAKTLKLDGICDTYFGRMSEEDDNGIAGKVLFTDIKLNDSSRAVSRIRVDKFTGGVMHGGLFTEEAIESGFETEIWAPDEPEILGLLCFALRDMGFGLCGFGGNRSIGRGNPENVRVRIFRNEKETAAFAFNENRKLSIGSGKEELMSWLGSLGGEKA